MTTVDLGEDLGIETSAALKARLEPHLAHDQDVLLDGAQVRRVHTAGLQVLCAFFASRSASGRTTALHDSSAALLDAIRLLGIGHTLGLPSPPRTHSNASTVENAA
ncbi:MULTISPECIES: STAS domain-containing protein [unclassified Luteimonas]|jgi:anti-anti-sigma regulatory factor|uniref:STAS domain-containing protein n=1 Tax=unclassified Luteimonas TaxID=2629088 RepID=UPI001616F4B2|nr:STAS domain-containing protein [Luteimonas sp. RC10]MBB3344432.1 anti-anti-sigma regulatory factor [Luteimonas sp. RC10]